MESLKWHPASEIKFKYSDELRGICIALGITSSVALYRAPDIARELIRRGATVFTVMSRKAARLLSPTVMEWATGCKVFVDFRGEVGHVSLGRECNSMLIAPATANTLVKIALGIADTSVSLTAINLMGLGKPVIVAPAMHLGLWRSPQVQRAINQLLRCGVTVIPPDVTEGKVKIPTTQDIVHAVTATTLRGRDLRGLRFLITAGPTREYLDPIRFITNPSTGKMGIVLAREAFFRGADVTLVYGPTNEQVPYYVRGISVTTTEEMLNAVIKELDMSKYDVVIMASAPSDFKFSKTFKERLSADKAIPDVSLVPTPKISLRVRERFKGLLVGFAAEYAHGDMEVVKERALNKLRTRGFDIVVANDVSEAGVGFASDFNKVIIMCRDGLIKEVSKAPKTHIARVLLDIVRDRVAPSKGSDTSSP
ncbi:MAG: bifunctional phosphopantothenoylcysteine decarboxylase/phosphopantothenate--cysteine ligase CoaBC [Thermoprotei archaeon]|nr:MAG: bifunctional phosphopantothenoylcysteine decarboxylase/phosphopantothenate--cysteine ligase CoaBC [Thermoprotei archaeon]